MTAIPKPSAYGTCRTCGRTIATFADGRARQHHRPSGVPCPGYGARTIPEPDHRPPARPTTPQPPPNVLTVDEVSRRLRVSKMTVYRLVHNGELGALRVGRMFRIPRRALDAYLAGEPWTPGKTA